MNRYRLVWATLIISLITPSRDGTQPSLRGGGTVVNAESATPSVFDALYVRGHYTKTIHHIRMRDGVKLYTVVFSPKSTAPAHPILMIRTPYSVAPYGEHDYPPALGPNVSFTKQDYIIVAQDVRGRYMSEGEFEDVRPHREQKSSPSDIDESTDTYDTIDYLINNIPNNNGRVGMWGRSYPGFYCSAGMIDAHPALKAVSPQAPIGDWFFDDYFHHGAFFLQASFHFLSAFGQARPTPTTQHATGIDLHTADGYQFFTNLGSLSNIDSRYFHGTIKFWSQIAKHPNYDEFWQDRNILPRLRHVAPAVLVVGGWFDAEDLYGTLSTYRAIEQQNPDVTNTLVMGPWRHTGWTSSDGDCLGSIRFGAKTSEFYQRNIELAFFNHYLKDDRDPRLPEAYVFETGGNQWRRFDHWPPRELYQEVLLLQGGGRLTGTAIPASQPAAVGPENPGYDAFISDPARPVPYTEDIVENVPPEYMTDDQRFAARRPDVLVYQTEPLEQAVTLAGPMQADLWVSTSAGDADWIVKVIDVFPPDAKDHAHMAPGRKMGGYQMLLRSEVVRGRFRENPFAPKPFKPDEPTRVVIPLQDVLHTFAAKHRIMVQIQSTWFPLVDRNPQKYVENIFEANESDFIKATHRVYHDERHPTQLRIGLFKGGLPEDPPVGQ